MAERGMSVNPKRGTKIVAMKAEEEVSMSAARITNQGFDVIPEVLTEAEIAGLSDELGRSRLHRSRAGLRHAMREPAVVSFARHPRLLQLARQVLGPGASPFRATLFDKSPASNWLVVWHQDTALPLKKRHETAGWGPWSVKDGISYAHAPASALEQVLALRVHLDNSPAQNGPLRVLPCTHTLGVLTDVQLHELAREVPAVDCLISRGGLVAMRPLIVHASSKSKNEQPRRVLHIEYSAVRSFGDGLDLLVA